VNVDQFVHLRVSGFTTHCNAQPSRVSTSLIGQRIERI
jgi:hypothetical protein